MYKIKYFLSQNHKNYVLEFLKTLNLKTRHKIIRSLDLLEKYGPQAENFLVKKLKFDLWELRVKHNKIQHRILFTQIENSIVLLHGFIKKRRKTPRKEINKALSRARKL